jgi:hypothetical protein
MEQRMPLYLEWFKCFGDNWCDLLEINLDNNHFNEMRGVYIIWCEGKKPAVLRVGQGNIREHLLWHKNDYVLAAFRQYGLYATWTKVQELECSGVERYLGETLKPVIGSRLPEAVPIKVNLPWEEISFFAEE